MVRNFILLSALLVSGFPALSIATSYDTPRMQIVYKVVEIDKLKITLDKSWNGYITFGDKKLLITPATKAYKKDVEVPLVKAVAQKNKYAEARYDFKTDQVISINWY